MFYFYLALSIIADLTVCFLTEFALWKPVVFLPAFFVLCIVFHFILFCTLSLFIKKKRTENIHNFFRSFMIVSLRLFFKIGLVRVTVEGKELLPCDRNFLFVCNHISVFDPIITITELAQYNLGFVSKKENIEIPIAGRYMLKSGCIGLDRENNRNAVTAINQAAENIANGVCSMGIYPEGYVNKNTGTLLEFRNGAFKIAKKAKCDIAVAVIENSREVNKNIFRKISSVRLTVLQVIPYNQIENLKTVEIGERVRSIMMESKGLK